MGLFVDKIEEKRGARFGALAAIQELNAALVSARAELLRRERDR